MKKTLATFVKAFGGIGFLMLAGALYWHHSTRAFVAAAARTPGVVTELALSHSGSDGATTFYPTVHFNTPEGRSIEFTSKSGSNPPAYSRGQSVTVLYRPGDPYDAKIDGFFSLWGGPLIIGSMGAIFFMIAVSIRRYSRNQQRQREYLRANGTPVQADFQSVEKDHSIKVNGQVPFRVLTQWRNPATQQLHVFPSENIWFDPAPYLEGRAKFTVFIDTRNLKKFHVDLSFLPELAE
jgi:hypothetical protein